MTRHQSEPGAKPTIPEVLERFVAYYLTPGNGAWGSLHAVLDDGNVDDGSCRFCVAWAAERGDAEGEALARILLTMSKTQRGKLSTKVHGTVRAREKEGTLDPWRGWQSVTPEGNPP